MNKRVKTVLWFWGPVFLWMTFIFILSSFEGSEIPDLPIPFFHTVVHFFEYSILGMLLFRALKSQSCKRSMLEIFVFAFILASCFAITDEWHQTFVFGRSGEIGDILWDILCILIGIGLYQFVRLVRVSLTPPEN